MICFFSFLMFALNVPTSFATAQLDDEALSMVPKGKLVEKDGRGDYWIRTTAGTKISVEFDAKGKLEEAEGSNLNKGDVLEPGQGLISLGSAAQKLTTAGHKIEGKWNLDRDPKFGWVYDLEGTLKGNAMEYLVDAKNGNIIKAED